MNAVGITRWYQLTGNVYFVIRGKKVHLKAVSILPWEAKKNGTIFSAELLPLMAK